MSGGFVRSISIGQNIPVEHIFYANTPAKYHFLFDYYVGKITQTGLHSVVNDISVWKKWGWDIFKKSLKAGGLLGISCFHRYICDFYV